MGEWVRFNNKIKIVWKKFKKFKFNEKFQKTKIIEKFSITL